METITRLSVNINKVATIRNARGGNNPDVEKVAADCERFGAQGITVHPRPDERHIRRSDVRQLSKIVTTEFNIEGYPSEEFMNLVLEVKPAQATLVPDDPSQITSNHGWDVVKYKPFLRGIVDRLRAASFVARPLRHRPVPSWAQGRRDRVYRLRCRAAPCGGGAWRTVRRHRPLHRARGGERGAAFRAVGHVFACDGASGALPEETTRLLRPRIARMSASRASRPTEVCA